MKVLEAIYGRRATRDFAGKPVGRDLITHLIEAAIQAPSAINEQPWRFTVIGERTILDRISQDSKSYALSNAAEHRLPQRLLDRLNDPAFHIFYNAPVLILISAVSNSTWAVEDCALAAENLMLAAHADGLGTCWIGFAQSWLQTPDAKKLLGLANECRPIAPIIVGYPLTVPAPPSRHRPEVRWIGMPAALP